MLNKVFDDMVIKIDKGEELSPFLFSGQNLEILNNQIRQLGLKLLSSLSIPKINLFILEDNGEKIKIEDLKKFLKLSVLDTGYKLQIFFIENISRMTLVTANSCLKFFEEPGKKNVVFLTNKGETGILDTILSRVQFVALPGSSLGDRDEFFLAMIKTHIYGGTDLISYFFRNKLEKDEYIRFLKNIIFFVKENETPAKFEISQKQEVRGRKNFRAGAYGLVSDLENIFSDEEIRSFSDISLEELDEDINMIFNNNVNPRGIVDKWILKLANNLAVGKI